MEARECAQHCKLNNNKRIVDKTSKLTNQFVGEIFKTLLCNTVSSYIIVCLERTDNHAVRGSQNLLVLKIIQKSLYTIMRHINFCQKVRRRSMNFMCIIIWHSNIGYISRLKFSQLQEIANLKGLYNQDTDRRHLS